MKSVKKMIATVNVPLVTPRRFLASLMILMMLATMIQGFAPLTAFAQGEASVVLSVGASSTFVVQKDGTLMGTGENSFGQLGLGHKNPIATFTKILTNVSTVSAAQYHTVALKRDGSLWGFGTGTSNRLPNGKNAFSPVIMMENVKMASAATNYTAAVDNDGVLYIMGNFSLGDGVLNNSGTFKKALDDVKYVYAGDDNCLVIKEDNSLWIWGLNNSGQLGDGSKNTIVSPAVKVMDDVTYASCGDGVMAIKKDGSLWMWGTTNIPAPSGVIKDLVLTPVKVLDNVQHCSQSANNPSYFVLLRDGSVLGYGSGHLLSAIYGDSTIATFTKVPNATNVVAISSESRHMAVVKKDLNLYTGGQSISGRLGYGNINKYDKHPLKQILSGVVDMPAAWSLAEVREAEYRQLVPPTMQSDYSKIVTRSEFCTLAIICIEQSQKMTIDAYLTSQSLAVTASAFTDIKGLSATAQRDIQAAFALGVVAGTGPTTFEPTKPITREQASKMLTATAAALKQDTSLTAPDFADQTAIETWAKPYLGYVVAQKIMGGVGNNRFDPKGGYQRQQAYMTMLRLFNAVQ